MIPNNRDILTIWNMTPSQSIINVANTKLKEVDLSCWFPYSSLGLEWFTLESTLPLRWVSQKDLRRITRIASWRQGTKL